MEKTRGTFGAFNGPPRPIFESPKSRPPELAPGDENLGAHHMRTAGTSVGESPEDCGESMSLWGPPGH